MLQVRTTVVALSQSNRCYARYGARYGALVALTGAFTSQSTNTMGPVHVVAFSHVYTKDSAVVDLGASRPYLPATHASGLSRRSNNNFFILPVARNAAISMYFFDILIGRRRHNRENASHQSNRTQRSHELVRMQEASAGSKPSSSRTTRHKDLSANTASQHNLEPSLGRHSHTRAKEHSKKGHYATQKASSSRVKRPHTDLRSSNSTPSPPKHKVKTPLPSRTSGLTSTTSYARHQEIHEQAKSTQAFDSAASTARPRNDFDISMHRLPREKDPVANHPSVRPALPPRPPKMQNVVQSPQASPEKPSTKSSMSFFSNNSSVSSSPCVSTASTSASSVVPEQPMPLDIEQEYFRQYHRFGFIVDREFRCPTFGTGATPSRRKDHRLYHSFWVSPQVRGFLSARETSIRHKDKEVVFPRNVKRKFTIRGSASHTNGAQSSTCLLLKRIEPPAYLQERAELSGTSCYCHKS